MANVSSSNGLEKRPKLRFPGFDEPWCEVKIKDIFRVTRGSVLAADKVLLSKIDGYEYPVYSSQTKADGLLGYYNTYLYENAITWTTDGANAGTVHYRAGKFYCTNVCGVLLNKDGYANRCTAAILGSISKKYVSYVGNPKLMNNIMSEIPIIIPALEEQHKIDSFIAVLDKRIKAQQMMITSLKKYKRGLSDSLFAHISQSSGCKIVKLGDAFDLLQNNTFSREDLTSELSTVQNIHYGDVLIKYGAIVNIAEDKPPYIKPDIELKKYSSASYLCDGDIVFADTAEDYTVGKATEIAGANGLSVLSGLHTIPCRPLIKFQPMYLGYYFNSSLFRTQIYPLIQGTKVSSISKGELIKANVYVPTLEEQKKIALLLYSMDCRITKEERKSSDLITARKALLQQLFI